jgi:hypothetical protein
LTTGKLKIDRCISDLVGTFTDPIIVMPGGWGDSLPEWLKTAVTLERLIENAKSLKGESPTGTDAEACAYLYTAGLTAPMDSDWAQIYLYVANQVYSRHRSKDCGVQIPKDIQVESISDYQMGELRRLKDWLYGRRNRARQEREQGERRKVKESQEDLQPALFDL